MLYYKVKPGFDQKKRRDGSILITNELYTPRKKNALIFQIKPLTRCKSPNVLYISFSVQDLEVKRIDNIMYFDFSVRCVS